MVAGVDPNSLPDLSQSHECPCTSLTYILEARHVWHSVASHWVVSLYHQNKTAIKLRLQINKGVTCASDSGPLPKSKSVTKVTHLPKPWSRVGRDLDVASRVHSRRAFALLTRVHHQSVDTGEGSEPCGLVSTRRTSVFTPVLFALRIYGGMYDPVMGPYWPGK